MATGEKKLFVVEDEGTINIGYAPTAGKALAHVVGSQYQVRRATAEDVAGFLQQGGVMFDTDPDVSAVPTAGEVG